MDVIDPAGGQRRDLEIKPFRSMMLLNSPAWMPPQIAIDSWWQQNGIDHDIVRAQRAIAYAQQKEGVYEIYSVDERI